jgi:RimK family alpha-L-glutamate ligase
MQMQVAILSARAGWHTRELCRALRERGHTGSVVPYEGIVASFGAHAPEEAFARLPAGEPAQGRAPAAPVRSVRDDDEGAALRSADRHPRIRRQRPRPTCWPAALTSGGVSLLHMDAVLARIIPNGSLEQIIYRVDALHWIEHHGVLVMNPPHAIERCVDKFYTDALLREAGLPTPETVVCEGIDAAMAAVRAMGDVIVKPIFGSMGQGLVRVSDPDVAFRVFRALEGARTVFYVQRAIGGGGRDVRVFVVGGAVIGAIERRAPAGEWRSNVARGARAVAVAVPDTWAAIARRAAAAVGAEYAGVDLLPAQDGSVVVLEINGIPGWRGLQEATGVDVAGAIVDRLAARVGAGRRAPAVSPA